MVIVNTGKRFGLTTQEIWFAEPDAKIPSSNRTIFYQATEVLKADVYQVEEFHTLAIDLHQSEETIHTNINRTFKYHIRKAEKLGITFRALDLNNNKDVLLYQQSFAEFVKRKKIIELPDWRLHALINAQTLIITVVEKDGMPITFHAYVQDKVRTRLLTSNNTTQTVFDENETGFCNKYHHWNDILFFKTAGFRWYDFGGISNNADDGRDYFKKSFGGERQVFCHFITCTGLLKLWFALRRLI
jgi:hypothetical protein